MGSNSYFHHLKKLFKWWKQYVFRDPLKRARKRVMLWYFGLILLIIFDEYIKEGYILNPRDFLIPLTHENIILILTIIAIALYKRIGRRGQS